MRMQALAGAEETKRARAPLGVWLECGLALLLVCLLSVAAGCGGGQNGGAAEPAKVPAASTPSSSGAALVWHDSEREAVAEASAEQLPIVVDFTADWCLPCRTLEEEVFQAPTVAAVLRSDFVLLRVDLSGDWDAPDKSALREKYGVGNLPAVRIVSVGGQVVAKVDELIEAEDFLGLLREARSS